VPQSLIISGDGGTGEAHAATSSGDFDGSNRKTGLASGEAAAAGAATSVSIAAADVAQRPSGERQQKGGEETSRGAGASRGGGEAPLQALSPLKLQLHPQPRLPTPFPHTQGVDGASGCKSGMDAIRLASSASDEAAVVADMTEGDDVEDTPSSSSPLQLSASGGGGETAAPDSDTDIDDEGDADDVGESTPPRGQSCSKTGRRRAQHAQLGTMARKATSYWACV